MDCIINRLEIVQRQISPWLTKTRENATKNLLPIVKTVEKIAVPLIIGFAGFALFVTQTTPFVFGAAVGIICPNKVQDWWNKGTDFWKRLSSVEKAVTLVAGAVAFSVTIPLASMAYGAYLTSTIAIKPIVNENQ